MDKLQLQNLLNELGIFKGKLTKFLVISRDIV